MRTWMILGKSGSRSVVLLAPEEDENFFHLGQRKGRLITEKLGLVQLASYLAGFGWQFEQAVELPAYQIASHCRDAVVGISVHINNYDNALALAKIAKDNGVQAVVLGGPHPTNRAEQIVKNQPDLVDYVVRGQGEEAFRLILDGEVSRGVVEEIHLPLEQLPARDRTLWPVGEAELSGLKMSVISLSEGCPMAMRGDACQFCSIHHAKRYSRRTVEQAVVEFEQLKAMGYGALEITDDDFPASFGKANLQLLAEEMEKRSLSFDIYIHAGVRSCNLDILRLLKRIGVKIIQPGFETADPEIKLEHASKATVQEEDVFVERCRELGFKLHLSSVFGMTGETPWSMEATFHRIEQIASTKGVIWAIQADPLIPLPGSRAFEELCMKHPEFAGIDHINVRKLMEAWFRAFTLVDLEDCIERREKMFARVNPPAVGGLLLKVKGMSMLQVAMIGLTSTIGLLCLRHASLFFTGVILGAIFLLVVEARRQGYRKNAKLCMLCCAIVCTIPLAIKVLFHLGLI